VNEQKEKLLQRPIESETSILKQSFVKFEDQNALYEKWHWDGITASSLIFLADDLKGKNKEDFIIYCLKTMKLDETQQTTHKTVGEYYFINFGFIIE
jgi:hypothetical protein